jgi:hypothetical protein
VVSGVLTPVGATGLRHRVADHAASGALRDLLEHHNLSYAPEPLSEGAIFGLSGALDLQVRITPTGVPCIDIEGRAPSLELDLCRHLGIDARWSVTDDPAAGWEALRRELDAGRPALLRADVAELDYHPHRCHDTRHVVLVIDCDVQAGVVWVLDRRFPEPQRCSLTALATARASCGWPEDARHGLLQVRPPTRLPDPQIAVAEALERVVRGMRHTRSHAHPYVRSGLAGIDELAAQWHELPRLAGPLLGKTLAGLCCRVREGGTGGALYRSLQARFEHDAAALLGSAQLGRAALVCDDLADAWRAFAAAAADDDDAERAHTVAGAWLERIRTLEHRHVDALELHLAMSAAAA